MITRWFIVAFAVVSSGLAHAQATWWVDAGAASPPTGSQSAPFSSIQSGLNAAASGDLVLVRPGTYFERINLLGKAVVLRSTSGPETTIIDGLGAGSVVTLNSGESWTTVIDGFTITGGQGGPGTGPAPFGEAGGIEAVDGSFGTIRNCRVRNNFGGPGGTTSTFSIVQGFFIANYFYWEAGPGGIGGQLLVEHCEITDNVGGTGVQGESAQCIGGANTGTDDSSIGGAGACSRVAGLVNCLIEGNVGGPGGPGGIGWDPCSGQGSNWAPAGTGGEGGPGGVSTPAGFTTYLIHCTLTNNWGGAGGIAGTNPTNIGQPGAMGAGAFYNDGMISLTNSIVWSNPGFSVYFTGANQPTANSCNIPFSANQPTNFTANPLFVNPTTSDFHLRPGSPCRDRGTFIMPFGIPVLRDLEGEARPNGVPDVGHDEFKLRLLADSQLPGRLMVENRFLTPGREYFNIVSLDLCPGGPGGGSYLGLCALNPSLLITQTQAPIGSEANHFLATNEVMTFGPYVGIPSMTMEAISIEVGATGLEVSEVLRFTVQ